MIRGFEPGEGLGAEKGAPGGDLSPQQSGHAMAVAAAIALLVQWGTVHAGPIGDDDIERIIDRVVMPLL